MKLLDALKDLAASGANPSEAYSNLCILHSNCHYYVHQWEKLSDETKLIGEIIHIVCRLEAGFQLCGFGVWLLNQIFTSMESFKTTSAIEEF